MTRLVFVVVLMLAMFAPGARAQDSDSLTWARANSCDSIRDYIARYPNGRHLTAAREQLRVRNCPDPNRPAQQPRVAQPQPQPQPQGDPCQQARTDWPAAERSTSLPVVRAYRDGLPAACGMWRARAEERITALQAEAAARRAEAQSRADYEQGVDQLMAEYERHSQALLAAFEALTPYAAFRRNCDRTERFDVVISRTASGPRFSGEALSDLSMGGEVYILSVQGNRVETISKREARSYSYAREGPAELRQDRRQVWEFRGDRFVWFQNSSSSTRFTPRRRCA